MLRRYRPLIARARNHAVVLWLWVALYAFVGIQMGWMLRPFVGSPHRPVTFFRPEPFSHAYVVVARMVVGRSRPPAVGSATNPPPPMSCTRRTPRT